MSDLGKNQILALTDIDDDTLEQWEKDGLRAAKTGRYKYDARQFFEWYLENIHRPAMSGPDGEGLSARDHKLRYDIARADKHEMQYKRKVEKLVDDVDAEAALNFTTQLFTDITDKLCEDLPPMLHLQSEEDILIKSDKHIRNILLNISKEAEDGEADQDGD